SSSHHPVIPLARPRSDNSLLTSHGATAMNESRSALSGLRVLDLTRVLAGPFCTMMLADLGAQVIKVERPGRGDDTRHFAPFVNGESAYYMNLNRNKLGVTLDL